MKVYTNKLGFKALNWAVAECEIKLEQQAGKRIENRVLENHTQGLYNPPPFSRDGELAYKIIIREKIQRKFDSTNSYNWTAWKHALPSNDEKAFGYGWTEIEAAMRCHVQAIMGDIIDVPEPMLMRTIHEIVLWDGLIIASVLREQDVGAMFDYFQAEFQNHTPVGQWSMSSRWKEVVDFRYAAQLTIVESDILNEAVHDNTDIEDDSPSLGM